VALRYLETERPRFLFIGLGDTDEYAHHGDYRGYVSALHFADAILGRLVTILDRFATEGRRTALFATADHGRAANFRDHGGFAPESANVWLGVRSPNTPFDQVFTGARLADIAPTIRRMLHPGQRPTAQNAIAGE
jgi:phosphopentomutase